jgi:hypothetical protein
MFQPEIWGPIMWQFLFSLAYKCPETCIEDMTTLLTLLDTLLPCSKCRTSYAEHRKRLDKVYKPFKNMRKVQFWMFDMKNLVNKKLKRSTQVAFTDVDMKYRLFDYMISDINLADVFMFIALAASEDTDVITFCHVSGRLMTGLIHGSLPTLLQCVTIPAKESVLQATNALRHSYGLSPRSLEYYRAAE